MKISNFEIQHQQLVIGGAFAQTSSRQVDLEPSVATVDRARSYSLWFRASNNGRLKGNYRILSSTSADGSVIQMTVFLIANENNTSDNGKIRCNIFTNSTNFITIQSSNSVNLGRWYHLVITYDGSEDENGLEMYLNGSLITTTKTETGTYTGAINNANLRFGYSSPLTTARYSGRIKDLAVWDKALNGTEVTETYNQGFPKPPTELSISANVVAHWPLRSDLAANNATYNLTGSGHSFLADYVNVEARNISFQRATIPNTRYLIAGGVIKKGDGVYSWFGRSGTNHIVNGKIVRIDFNLAAGTASAPADVIVDGTYDVRGGVIGIDDNGIIRYFGSRYNGGTDTFIDTGIFTSTDDGATFGSISTVSTTYDRYNFFGKHIKLSAGTFVVPFFEHDGTNYIISIFKTADNWATHSKITAFSGTTKLTEPAIADLGGGNLIILARRDGTGAGLYQILSNDNGATWGAATLTNLAGTAGIANCDINVMPNGKVNVLLMYRGGVTVNLSKDNNISTILSGATNWNTPTPLTDSYETDPFGILGYPDFEVLPDGRVLAVYCAQFSSTRADLFFGIGSL